MSTRPLAFESVSSEPRPRVALRSSAATRKSQACASDSRRPLTIVGMMLKIVPFLVWYRVYAPQVGRAAVPTLAQLARPALEGLAWWLLTGGVLGLAAALAAGSAAWIRAAGAVLTLGALAFAATLGATLQHLRARTPAARAGSAVGAAVQ